MAASTEEPAAFRARAFPVGRRHSVLGGLAAWGVLMVVVALVAGCTSRDEATPAQPKPEEAPLVEFEDPRCGPDVTFFCAGSVRVDCSDGERTDCQATEESCVPGMGCLRSCDPDFL